MLKISKQSDYGLLILSYLKNKKGFVSISEMVNNLNLPKRFIARIASVLANHEILVSKEGKIGGYRLSSKIKKIYLLDYLKIFEQDLINLTQCSKENYQCPWEIYCHHKNLFKDKLKKILINQLKNYRLFNVI